MNKFQNIKFNNIHDFLDYLPENERKIVDKLRKITLDAMPGCKEKLSYNVPYYFMHSRVTFIWPAAVPWGKTKREGVQYGFCRGYLLADEDNYLEKENRKEVYIKTFYSSKEIDADILRTYILDAVFVDAEMANKKNASR